MNHLLRTKGSPALVVFATLLAACAKELPELPVETYPVASISNAFVNAPGTLADEQTVDQPLNVVANDLVNALSFISGIAPTLTTINLPATGTEFNELVKAALVKRNYQIDNRLERSNITRLTTSSLNVDRGSNSSEITGIVAINSVLVKRTYLVSDGVIEPKTPYIIRGISPQLVQKSDQIRVL